MTHSTHFNDLRGANLLETPSWILGRQAIKEVAAKRSIASLTGEPGTGKSFCLASVAPELPLPVRRIEFDHRPTMRSVTVALLERLTKNTSSGSKRDLLTPLIECLATPVVLMVDEAQRLNRECLDHLRYLHDHRETSFALVLAGGQGCWEVLGREPQLRRRIWRPVFFTPLTADEVPRLVPAFHPVWKGFSKQAITTIDSEFAVGILGHWAAITDTMVDLRRDRKKLKEAELVEFALFKHGAVEAPHHGGS